MPAAGGGAGYHALTFICYKVISPVRHTVSLAISAGLVKRMERTRPWYFKTSSDIVKEAKETGGEVKERHSEKKVEDMKNIVREKRDDIWEKYDDLRKKS